MRRAHDTDAGFDLCAAEDIPVIMAHERVRVRTGVSVAIPRGYVGLVKDRSSVATQKGLTTLAGVIDSGYRGEIIVVLFNTNDAWEPVRIVKGDRIAQLVVVPCLTDAEEVESLDGTDRGCGGFGSTGV